MPRTLPQALAFVLGFWLALYLSPLCVRVAPESQAPRFASLEADFHTAVNELRQESHRIALRRLPELDRVARAHSADMARRGYLSHDTPEGVNPVERLHHAGVSGFSLAAENVGLTDRGDPNREILQHWLASPVHRGNLLAPPFNSTGIGVARATDGSLLYTQVYVTFPR